ncbi:hypothetical protein L202_01997 [Cryptococcus amylolentus CBS 6039]|uniref:Ig-like domain-containing protein n=2 Tax=Cryptococcus amylolentus TaxID=104669 RepID=A0A1E3HZ25_9TREE|nr:hypothetical protein L202_01997 [Cryptococcus amylolentus CBS 6039]ODN81584.1 hypothetical protein L202_01997 [Cryptococcus amylolentus CBS 6039]ODO10193.1 hypothetical protein I350_02422 [Cryptococcus amylolentus CBS 6273]
MLAQKALTPAVLLAILPFSLAAPASDPSSVLVSSSVAAPISSSSSSSDEPAPSLYIRLDPFSTIQSHNDNEGDGDGQKRSYGLDGPGDIAFAFGDPEDYTAETFWVRYYKTAGVDPSVTGKFEIPDPTVWATGNPTTVVQCVATATASSKEDADVVPVPGLSTTTGAYQVKCSGLAE